MEEKKEQFDRKNLNILVIRNDALFRSGAGMPSHIDMLEQFVYDHDYLALLIILGGHVRQKMVEEPTLETIKDEANHLYVLQAINQNAKEILIITNNYSREKTKTLSFSSRIREAFKSCKTMLT